MLQYCIWADLWIIHLPTCFHKIIFDMGIILVWLYGGVWRVERVHSGNLCTVWYNDCIFKQQFYPALGHRLPWWWQYPGSFLITAGLPYTLFGHKQTKCPIVCFAKWGELPLEISLLDASTEWYYGVNVTIDHKSRGATPACFFSQSQCFQIVSLADTSYFYFLLLSFARFPTLFLFPTRNLRIQQ